MTEQTTDQVVVSSGSSLESTPTSRRNAREIYSSLKPAPSATAPSTIDSVEVSSPFTQSGQPIKPETLSPNSLHPQTAEYVLGMLPVDSTPPKSKPQATTESAHPFTDIRTDSNELHQNIQQLLKDDPLSQQIHTDETHAMSLIGHLDQLTNQVSNRHIKDDPNFKQQLSDSESWLDNLHNSLSKETGTAPGSTAQKDGLQSVAQDESKFDSSIKSTIAPAFHDKEPVSPPKEPAPPPKEPVPPPKEPAPPPKEPVPPPKEPAPPPKEPVPPPKEPVPPPKEPVPPTNQSDGMVLGINGITQLNSAVKAGLNFSEVRLWDTGVKINQLTNADGSKNTNGWNNLSNLVDTAHADGKQVMYTFGLAADKNGQLPATPSDAQLASFAKNLAQWSAQQKKEGKGGIDTYEMWNEPSYDGFWKGTPEQLAQANVQMMQEIKKYDPTAKIATPANSFNTRNQNTPIDFSNRYFTEIEKETGSLSDFNQVDFHGYRDQTKNETPEQLLTTDQSMKSLEQKWGLHVPLVDSEDSFHTAQTTGTQDESNLMARQLIVDEFEGVQPGWYAYGNDKWGTMETGGKPLPDALQEPTVMSWMQGAKLEGIKQDGNVYLATMDREGKTQRIVWTTGASQSYDPGSTYSKYETLAGTTGDIGDSLTVSGEPTLIS